MPKDTLGYSPRSGGKESGVRSRTQGTRRKVSPLLIAAGALGLTGIAVTALNACDADPINTAQAHKVPSTPTPDGTPTPTAEQQFEQTVKSEIAAVQQNIKDYNVYYNRTHKLTAPLRNGFYDLNTNAPWTLGNHDGLAYVLNAGVVDFGTLNNPDDILFCVYPTSQGLAVGEFRVDPTTGTIGQSTTENNQPGRNGNSITLWKNALNPNDQNYDEEKSHIKIITNKQEWSQDVALLMNGTDDIQAGPQLTARYTGVDAQGNPNPTIPRLVGEMLTGFDGSANDQGFRHAILNGKFNKSNSVLLGDPQAWDKLLKLAKDSSTTKNLPNVGVVLYAFQEDLQAINK